MSVTVSSGRDKIQSVISLPLLAPVNKQIFSCISYRKKMFSGVKLSMGSFILLMDSEILDQLTTLQKNVDSEVTKPKKGRKKKIDTKINEVEESDVRDKRERLVACVLSGNSNQSSDILQHSQNRPTGDRWLKF